MRYRDARVIYPLLILTGCARATTSNPPIPETDRSPETVSVTVPGTSRQVWILKSDPTPQRYTSVSNVTLDLASSSGVSRDSMIVTSRYSLTYDRTDESIAGQVDQYSITAGNRVGPVSAANVPMQFAGKVTHGQVLIQPSGSAVQGTSVRSGCPDLSLTIISGIRRSILVLPSRISPGMTWQDSTTSTICHGSTPVSLTLTHTYRIIDEVTWRGQPAILIERQGKSLSTGDGSDGQHRVAVAGEGVIRGKLYVDTSSGLVIEAEQDQEMRLTITSSGRSQKFIQTIHEVITLADQ